MSATTSRITDLLENRTLGRLEQHRIGRGSQTSRRRGERLARGRGRSIDFADYRDYVAGDDIRFVDWNIFARLRRPYVKLFQEEEERHLAVLVDGSASMGFDGKLDRARQLAAALGMVGLVGAERVSCYTLSPGSDPCLVRPTTGRAGMGKLFAALERIEPGGDAMIEDAVEALVRVHRGRGIALVISDFLTFGALQGPLNQLANAGLEPWAIQVLAPSELDPELDGDLRLKDAETGWTVDVTGAGELLSLYHEYRQALERQLSRLCRARGGRFRRVSSDESLTDVLFGALRRQGWITSR